MKSLLIIALTLITFAAKAQTPAAKETTTATIVNMANTAAEAPAAMSATEASPAQDATAGSAPNISANFVGTNDLNLLLLREGVKKA